MAEVKIPLASKLIAGLIYKENTIAFQALRTLERKFGAIDFRSGELEFDYTDYYYSELGRPLKRLFVSFKHLLLEDTLPEIKIYTARLENRFSLAGRRRVNIDPGFLSLGKLVLATAKDNQQRIYLGKGIFAEVTLFFKDKTFKAWDWTYPDYQTKEYINIFNSIRDIYSTQIKKDVSKLS